MENKQTHTAKTWNYQNNTYKESKPNDQPKTGNQQGELFKVYCCIFLFLSILLGIEIMHSQVFISKTDAYPSFTPTWYKLLLVELRF